MTYYVKSEPGYERVTYNRAKVRAAALRQRKARKKPTSLALDPAVILELKREAEARGLPYQVLMRMLIVEGLKKLKRAS
jgi:predicted DNA binding CopG/RHH family protein